MKGKFDKATAEVFVPSGYWTPVQAQRSNNQWKIGCLNDERRFISFAEDSYLRETFYNYGACPPAYRTPEEVP